MDEATRLEAEALAGAGDLTELVRHLREVTAFPKTQRSTCLMSETPSTVDPGQLQELHIKVR